MWKNKIKRGEKEQRGKRRQAHEADKIDGYKGELPERKRERGGEEMRRGIYLP